MQKTRVYLVRHAKAEPQGADDAGRRLTPEGRAAFERLLGALAARLVPSRVLASPFARARETAELLAARTGRSVEEEPALASGASTGAGVLALARRAGEGAALVGHNPELAEAVALAAGRELAVKPGAVAALDLVGDRATLAWLEAP